MEKDPLDRRSFLRLCMVAAGGTVLAACQQALPEAVGTSTVSPSPAPSVKLSLPGGDLDVWAWVKQVKVKVSEGECESVAVDVQGDTFEAGPDGEGFTAEIPVSAGTQTVSAVCRQPGGEEVRSDPVLYTGRLRQIPTAVIRIDLRDGRVLLDGSDSLPAEDGLASISQWTWSARGDNPAPLQLENGELNGEMHGPDISVLPPDIDGEYYIQLRVKDEAGREDASSIYIVVQDGQPRIPDYDREHPAWVDQAVVYGVIPFLFGSPAFDALRARLDDLADLGINALWLGPINVHPADDYGYAVEDYFGLDPAYGTEEDFRRLVQAAHERGIRVLMDFVPNHTSATHPYFLDAQQRGLDSNYWDFYDRDVQGEYTYYFQWSHLPNLNYDNPEVRRMMIEAFSYWVRELDVDGFRVDVAWGIQERRPDFWPEWRRALKRIKPDLLLVAEATAREPYYFDNGFDAAYDWTYQPGGWAWKIAWDAYKYRLLSYNLTEALTNSPEGFHPDALIFRFLNNNDTGQRFITRHGVGVTRVATAFLLSLPGIPSIYTGDEYGLEFEPYQQLEPLDFVEQYPGLRAYHKRLIALRKALPSLRARALTVIKPDAIPQSVFAYIRHGEPSDMPVIVLLNFSEEPAEFEFDLPQEFRMLAQRGSLYDLLAEEEVPSSAGGRMRVTVPGQTARLLTEAPVE